MSRVITVPPLQRSRRRSRRRWPRVVAVMLGAIVAAATIAALQVRAARADLQSAREAAERGAEALLSGEVEAAEADLTAAQDSFQRGGGRLRNPLVRAAGVLPVIRPNLREATALADAGALVASAGRGVAATITGLPGGIAALAPTDGALPVDALAAVGPSVTHARGRVEEARALVAATPADGLVAEVADARAALVAELDQAAGVLEVAEPLVRVLPSFLGADGPRRYFFGAAQPAELRGSTGFIGAYAILTLDRGVFSFSPFSPIQDLPSAPPGLVEPPNPDFLPRYGDFGGTGFWQNLNVSPDFPTTGTAVERLWEYTFGERLDGVISADPFALAALLDVAGPTEVPGVGPIDADSVVPFVSNQAYGVFRGADERKRLLGDVAAAALAGFLNSGLNAGPEDGSGAAGAVAALRALAGAVDERHILLHAADPHVQSGLEEAGVAGAVLNPAGDYFAAILNGASGSKIDYYLDRELFYTAVLEPRGVVRSTASLRLRNDAPTSGQPSYVIGPNTPRVVPGENELYVSAYLASSAQFRGVSVDGAPVQGQLETELGHPVVETFEELPSGATRELRYEASTPGAWSQQGEEGVYRLTIQEQATIRPTHATVEVRLPEGMTVVETDRGWSAEDNILRYSGDLRGTFTAEVVFAPR